MSKAAAPSAYGPSDIRSAYKLTTSSSATVAIVDAYDDPNAEADLAVYSRRLWPGSAVHHPTTAFGSPKPRRGHDTPQGERRLGGGDLPRRRHGLRDLPELPYPACRGQDRHSSYLIAAEAVTRGDWAPVLPPSATARRGRVEHRGEPRGTTPPGHRRSRPRPRRQWLRSEVAGLRPQVIAVGGTELVGPTRPREVGRNPCGGARGSVARPSIPSPSGSRPLTTARGSSQSDVSAIADPATGVAVYDSTPSGGRWWMDFGGTSVRPRSSRASTPCPTATPPDPAQIPGPHPLGAQRRDLREQRQLHPASSACGQLRLGRRDGPGHSERRQGLLTGCSASRDQR